MRRAKKLCLFFISIFLNIFFLRINFVSANFDPIEIKEVKTYATDIEITVPNLSLPDNEKYYLYCEQRRIPSNNNYSYQSPHKNWRYKNQPDYSKNEYKHPNTITLSLKAIKNSEYKCTAAIYAEGLNRKKYIIQKSDPIFIKTLDGHISNYKNKKEGLRAQYANRVKKSIPRSIISRRTIVIYNNQNHKNRFVWGPKYYKANFFIRNKKIISSKALPLMEERILQKGSLKKKFETRGALLH